jgi:tetratricopeptide (TPR) repeat protein
MKQALDATSANRVRTGLIAALWIAVSISVPTHAQIASIRPEEPLRPAFLSSDDEDEAEQQETARLFEQLEGNFAFGEYREAVNPARLMVEIATVEYGPDAAELAEPLINLGQALEFAGEAEQARQTYLASIELVGKQFGPLNRRMVRPQAGLARLAQAQGDHEAAVAHFTQARYLLRRAEGLYSMQQIPLLEATARSLIELGKTEEADAKQRLVYELYVRKYGRDSPELIGPLIRLGNWNGLMYLAMSPETQASMLCMIDRRSLPDYSTPRQCVLPGQRDLYRMAIELIEENYGKDDPRLIEPLRALANSYYIMAVRWVKRQDSQGSIFTTGAPASYYEAVGQEGNARQALERALAILRAQPDRDPMAEAQLLIDLGDWHLAFRRTIDDGKAYYQQAWQLIADTQGGADVANLSFSKPTQLIAREPTYPNFYQGQPEFGKSGEASLGFITFQFDVTADGNVLNEDILESSPEVPQGINSRALRALSKTHFRPRIVDGLAVYTSGATLRHSLSGAD